MNSEIITALARLVAGEQRDDEALVDTLTRIKAERDQLRLDEVSLSAILFGDEHTTDKGFREMAARVRELQTFVWPSVAECCRGNSGQGELEEVVDWQDDNCGWDGEDDDDI